MKKECKKCRNEFIGRSDKYFCSTICKNQYHYELRKNTRFVVQEIDAYLHRNREILAMLLGDSNKETIDRLQLVRSGFRFDYMTGIYFNREHKIYRLVYDYAWMDFSDQKVLIIRKKNS